MTKCLISLVATVLFAACSPCKPLAQRCHNGVAQLCDTAGKWRSALKCNELTAPHAPSWECYCMQDTKKCSCRRTK